MAWIRKPDLPAILGGERPLLDRIFGEGSYSIRSDHHHEVSVCSSRLRLDIGYDTRDQSISSMLTAIESWGKEVDRPEIWARFLGDRLRRVPCAASGRVNLGPEEQIRAELRGVLRLSQEVFSDPQKARDAINFVRGYRTAYNDWAGGAWSPD